MIQASISKFAISLQVNLQQAYKQICNKPRSIRFMQAIRQIVKFKLQYKKDHNNDIKKVKNRNQRFPQVNSTWPLVNSIWIQFSQQKITFKLSNYYLPIFIFCFTYCKLHIYNQIYKLYKGSAKNNNNKLFRITVLDNLIISTNHKRMTTANWKQQHPGFVSLLSSLQNQPIQKILDKWQSKVRNGHIKRITDTQIQLPVFQISGTNINNNLIAFPKEKQHSMKMKLPVLVLLVKNMEKYFRFEVTVLDDKNVKRTFTSANNQSITRVKPFQCSMPLQMDAGWNQIVFNLQQYCQKAFGTKYVQCQRVQVNANCRIARIYFNDKVKQQDQIPPDYKLFMRVKSFKN